MKRVPAAAFTAAVFLSSSSAFAQTSAPAAPKSSSFTATIAGGLSMTKKTGGVISGEVAKTLWPGAEVSLEGGWMSSVVNAHRIDAAGAIAGYLAQTQGQTASASVKVPTGYGAANFRYAFYLKPRYSIYALGGVGVGVVNPKTTFVLAGGGLGGGVSRYGVTIGKDLGGHSTGALVNLGIGATIPHGNWVGDASYRITPLFTAGETTVVNRLMFGVGRRF